MIQYGLNKQKGHFSNLILIAFFSSWMPISPAYFEIEFGGARFNIQRYDYSMQFFSFPRSINLLAALKPP